MIDRILDNYYSKQLVKYINDKILYAYYLDKKIEYTKDFVSIYIKPKYYKNYTCLIHTLKKDVCNYLLYLISDNGDEIKDYINTLSKENAWDKYGQAYN